MIVGANVAHYSILARLGAGGMGEVYKALDTKLGRPVALKILPVDLVSDPERMRRFVQEAKSASALNHPHIVTIYEVGQARPDMPEESIRFDFPGESVDLPSVLPNVIHYIAMEYVEGDTLRAKIHRDKTDLKQLIEYLAQAADGLAKAHSAGIVHRDLKPENIMVTPDGYAKVLDFGLAKLIERGGPDSGDPEEAATVLMEQSTRPGMLMGTPGYMSPEQVQGKPVDHRSDIFSFGCMLYEAATGQRPFQGESAIDSLHKIVYGQAAPIKDFNSGAPAELQRIVRKCLAKKPDERYQSIKDVAIDLRELAREYDSLPPVTSTYMGTGALSAYPSYPSGSTVSGPVPLVQRKSSLSPVFAALALIVTAALAFGIYQFAGSSGEKAVAPAPFQSRQITRLTSTGNVNDAVISPDGKYVVYLVGEQSLWVRQVATSRNMQIVMPVEGYIRELAFSPDGNYVYYTKGQPNSAVRVLYRVPVLGGDPRKILEDIDSGVTFSPDGSQIAFVRGYPVEKESALMVARTDGGGERKLAIRNRPNEFITPAWSPDGKIIACTARGVNDGPYLNVVEVEADTGAERPLSAERWVALGSIAWLADGTGLLATAADHASRSSQVWHIARSTGEARRVTNDLDNYYSVSLSADSRVMTLVESDQVSSVWIVPGGDTNRARQITSGSGRFNRFSWSPDGRIVYTAGAGGARDIWVMDADGRNQKQLTSDAGFHGYPVVSPDGKYIIFNSNRGGNAYVFNLWRVDIDGSNPKQLTSGDGEFAPSFSPDGQWVVYTAISGGRNTLWRVRIDGGEPVRLTEKFSTFSAVSPDGKWIACHYWDEQPGARLLTVIIPFDGGAPVKTFDIPSNVVKWSPDGRSLLYADQTGGVANVWSQPVAGGAPKQVTDFKSDLIFDFEWSRDARQLACTRGFYAADVVLMSEIN